MPAVTIRNLSAETHRALKLRAARHGRSAEAEVRAILDEAVRPKGRLKDRRGIGGVRAALRRRRARDGARSPADRTGVVRVIILDTNVVAEPMKVNANPAVAAGSTGKRLRRCI